MFLGHFGVAFAAKKLASKTSLGTLFMACEFLDLVWPVLVLVGVEKVSIVPHITAVNAMNFESYPFSHSLVGSLVLSVIVGAIYFALTRRGRSAAVVGAVVFSHWILDLIVHRPDLPLFGDESPKLGFGLWNSVPGTLVVESILYFGGLALYGNSAEAPKSPKKKYSLLLLVTLLFIIYMINIFGPKPPPDTPPAMIAGPALALWLFVLWAWWIDKKPKT